MWMWWMWWWVLWCEFSAVRVLGAAVVPAGLTGYRIQATGHPPGERRERPVGVAVVVVVVIVGRWREGGTSIGRCTFHPWGQWLLQWLLQRSGCYSGMGWTPSTPSGLCQSPLEAVQKPTGWWRRHRGIALAGGG
ncbi:hypothetical protein BGZ61DRAFT_520841 [Ilyonectria robusta]|uniref:uncharacterized protein n=1 Tax=Ilyonectria robusta TaxID=1079257 RepID=UPI001E8EE18A|nr:uncharacterized protein BGZ61DRAFT_520841 [Ilyonectria robusta]KAH8674966.1 hypothetical protein BGZ61DRAFT_520841 [Ilyonectria robusta]